jgi:hypothetical protein
MQLKIAFLASFLTVALANVSPLLFSGHLTSLTSHSLSSRPAPYATLPMPLRGEIDTDLPPRIGGA